MKRAATFIAIGVVNGCIGTKGESDTAWSECVGSELSREGVDTASLTSIDSQLAENFSVFESFVGTSSVQLTCGEDECEAVLDISPPTQCQLVDYEMGLRCDKDLVVVCMTEVLLQGCSGFEVSGEYELVVNGGDTSHDPEAFEIKSEDFWMLANPNGEARIKRAEDEDASCGTELWAPDE